MLRSTLIVIAAAILPACAESTAGEKEERRVRTEVVEYRHGDTVLEGFLAEPAEEGDKRPAILVVHAWMGIGDHERESAEALARLGFVAFCADIYGKGVRPANRGEAAAQATIYRSDRALMRARARAGLDWLKARANTDPDRVAAIGYCFGGGTVLELARSGADLAGVVSFHGNLDTPDPADAEKIRCRVLVLHGAADPHVPMKQVGALAEEMNAAKVDWSLVMYGGAVHSFSDPGAGTDPSRGAAYDVKAANRSWREMLALFDEIF